MNIVGRAPSYRKYIQRPGVAAQLVPGSSIFGRHRKIVKFNDEIEFVNHTDDGRRADHRRKRLIHGFQLPAFLEPVLNDGCLILHQQYTQLSLADRVSAVHTQVQ